MAARALDSRMERLEGLIQAAMAAKDKAEAEAEQRRITLAELEKSSALEIRMLQDSLRENAEEMDRQVRLLEGSLADARAEVGLKNVVLTKLAAELTELQATLAKQAKALDLVAGPKSLEARLERLENVTTRENARLQSELEDQNRVLRDELHRTRMELVEHHQKEVEAAVERAIGCHLIELRHISECSGGVVPSTLASPTPLSVEASEINNLKSLSIANNMQVFEILQLCRTPSELNTLMDEHHIVGFLRRKRIMAEYQQLCCWDTKEADSRSRFTKFSGSCYVVAEGGATLRAIEEPAGRVAVCAGSVMTDDGVFFAEVELGELSPGAYIGIARPWLDEELKYAYGSNEFWGLGMPAAKLWHHYDATKSAKDWQGMEPFTKGDTLGLLVHCGEGSLAVYKNGARLGLAVEKGLRGDLGLCWAAALGDNGDCIKLIGKPLPSQI